MATATSDLGSIHQIIQDICACSTVKNATYHMITSTNSGLSVPFVKTTYPQEWISYYLLNNLMAVDPIVSHGQDAKGPFFWAELPVSNSASRMMKKAHEFGLSLDGYTVPTVDVGPYRGLFSLCPEQNADPMEWRAFVDRNKADIEKIAYKIHSLARVQIDPYEGYAKALSRREVECLQLIAGGKTHTEMAAILGISEHTVRSYCRALRLKLNCSTLAQAVAKACALGII
jgi:LuxR family transcriptional regulator, quorum-sensing system regulator CinR